MKKLYVSFLVLLPFLSVAQQRLVLLEHFTQASCGPCAYYGPTLTAAVNTCGAKLITIKYHTSWPGVDPMYNHDPADVNARVSYYNVTGVPNSVLDGNVFNGPPPGSTGGWSATTVDTRYAVASPFNMSVSQSILSHQGTTPDTIVLTVGIRALQNITQPLVLRSSVIERDVRFATPPGTNGETDFEYVFKKMLPSASGQALPATMTAGDTLTFSYKWKLANIYDYSQLACVAFIQNTTTKEVKQTAYQAPSLGMTLAFNSGPKLTRLATSATDTTWYNVDFTPTNDQGLDQYKLTLAKTSVPAGWQAFMNIDGSIHPDTTLVTLNSADTKTIKIGVVGNGTRNKVARFQLQANCNTRLWKYKKTQSAVTIGPSDALFVPKDAAPGILKTAMTVAGITNATITADEFAALDTNGFSPAALRNVYIYTGAVATQTLTDDQTALLTNYLNQGGKLFIAGQDLGFDAFDANGGNSTALQTFYTDYLGANYVSDFVTCGLPLITVATDSAFGAVPYGRINPGTNANGWSPDEISLNPTSPNAYASLYIDSVINGKIAAIRNNGTNWKTVYMPIRWDQIVTSTQNTTFSNAFMRAVRIWFNGPDSVTALAPAQKMFAFGAAYPNPANHSLQIPINTQAGAAAIQVSDALGRTVLRQSIQPDAATQELNTAALAPGMYLLNITGNNGQLLNKQKFTVSR